MPAPHDSMNSTLITFAVRDEALPFLQRPATGVDHLITNIGRTAAERAMEKYLQSKRPSLLLTCGFCGGLDPDLASGDVRYDTLDLDLDQRLAEAGLRRARFYTSDRIIISAGEKRQLRDTSGCDAVEMESGAIATICRRANIPVATIRVVSDTADEDLPLDFNRVTNPDGKLQFGKLAMMIAASPWKIPALIRLGGNSKNAANRLATVLHELLPGLGVR